MYGKIFCTGVIAGWLMNCLLDVLVHHPVLWMSNVVGAVGGSGIVVAFLYVKHEKVYIKVVHD